MPDQERGQRGGERRDGGERPGGGDRRDGGGGGGFRIRLSDNELRAARTIQDAFQLRSTVAVLGFALRTVAQLLEQGALSELVEAQQQQPRERNERAGEPRDRGVRAERGERVERAPKPDPFARPSKPVVEVEEPEVEESVAEEINEETPSEEGISEEIVSEESTPESETTSES